MANNVVAGVVEVALDGSPIPVRDEAKFTKTGVAAKPGIGLDRHLFVIKTPSEVNFEITLSDLHDFDITRVYAFNGGAVTVKCDNGKLYTMSNASYCGDGTIDLKDGKISKISFACSPDDFTISQW